ncbi:fungal-specific transcription factor domain-containing protein [Aspergillus transmontanensis]|uniref:Fungal-specific transcription factor domain-containing protein n=1 Tax=Aspergillus transmontanensis TaxID=1034304 RepID=A0A5N6VIA7_9EURO|nr:fungal-specific transcription factor domain-containing protein [Aspergillus transmontanensis]
MTNLQFLSWKEQPTMFNASSSDAKSYNHGESAAESATQPDSYAATPEDRKFFWVLGSEPYLSATSLVSHIADHTEEDFNRDDFTRATGFIGKSSEISWLQMLSKYVNSGCEVCHPTSDIPSPALTSSCDGPIASSNYHLDDFDMPTVERLDTSELPSKDTATKLFNAYLSSVHPSFPIIGISTFASQFQAFFHNPSLKPGNKWLAILNLIFAIGARYAHLTNAEWRRDEDDHYSYFIRARNMSLDGQLLHHSDLQQLQVEGLASFYMLSSGHINRSRSWKLCGSAVRSALSLGLHLRNIGTCTSDTSKEIRYRVWWALYTLEHRLSVMTGRPSCIIDVACTTPLPVPFDESDFRKESVMRLINRSTPEDLSQPGPASNSSPNSNLRKTGKGMESADASAAALEKPWSSMEFAIRGLMFDLDSWLINLPAAYDFTSTHTSQGSATHRMSLALTFYSTKIGITKPCLRRIESSALGDKSEEFCRKAAAECVESACHMLRLFPEPLEASSLHKLSPWWCILHFLMQATAVLLIELSFHVQHVPEKAAMVSKAAIKSYDWLAVMSETSMASEKARRMCDEFLRRLGFNGGAKIHSFPCIAGLASRNSPDDEPHDPRPRLTRIVTPDGFRGGVGPMPLSPVDHSTAAFARPLSVGLEAPEAHEFDQDEKALAVHNLYDGYLPYDPNTGQITGSFFPPEDDIDIGLGPYYWDEAMGDHYYQQPASASPVIPNDPR